MKRYFCAMDSVGRKISESSIKSMNENASQIDEISQKITELSNKALNQGLAVEDLHKRGEKTAVERIEYLVDEGSWLPLNTIYNPEFNKYGTTGVINGLGKIGGKWCSIIASNNRVLAGAWIPGQAENVFRAQDIAERLRIPLVWVLNCSGVSLSEQEKIYAGRRCGGRSFFRHAELAQKGIPVIVGIFGANPAGGGYHSISPAIIFAHEKASMAVGGGGIVSGMSPKGGFDKSGAEQLIEITKKFKHQPPGSMKIHHDVTGFVRQVLSTEEGVLDAIKNCVAGLPAYNSQFFRVCESTEPELSPEDLKYIIPVNQKRTYDFNQVIGRLVDKSEHMEYRPEFGPEIYTALAKADGLLVGVIANKQGFLGEGYPKYADYPGIGGKLYREGLIKMNEFVTLCGRDRVPVVWIQDNTGIDVGDIAEKAELLGLGQALLYSIESSMLPMITVILRKGSAASHYVMGGPQGNNNNAFTLGTPATEIYVMHGETAAVASYARRLVKDKEEGKDTQGTIDKMNKLVQEYHDKSRPDYSAQTGFVDEIVDFTALRKYIVAFANACYQNPSSICPQHQMLIPRLIKPNI
jgi:glutaconyl-CoA decarboxylase